MKTLITDIQCFSLNDGPGIRSTVFFKGCNMHCSWCHNPETLSFKRELVFYPEKCIGCGSCFSSCPNQVHVIKDAKHVINREVCVKCGKCAQLCYAEALCMSGREMTIREVVDEVIRDKAYYYESGGGVTLSGGEVLCNAEYAIKLTQALHKEKIKVAIETNLSLPFSQVSELINSVDLVMADIKLFDDDAHKKYTGVSNKYVLENIMRIDKPLIVRTPLIPGVTATKENLSAIAQFLEKKEKLLYYQLLNYNPLGETKYKALGEQYRFSGDRPFSDEEMKKFGDYLKPYRIKIKVGD